jgi:hypothetical protein
MDLLNRCLECNYFRLYHDCDDPDILSEERKVKNKENCATYICNSDKCFYIIKLKEENND